MIPDKVSNEIGAKLPNYEKFFSNDPRIRTLGVRVFPKRNVNCIPNSESRRQTVGARPPFARIEDRYNWPPTMDWL
jgi:hypothetical protein